MANGDLQGVWEKVNRIAEDGCAHKTSHDRAINDLRETVKRDTADIWSAIDRERTAREGMIKQIVVGVLIIVVGGVVLNMVALSYLLPTVLK